MYSYCTPNRNSVCLPPTPPAQPPTRHDSAAAEARPAAAPLPRRSTAPRHHASRRRQRKSPAPPAEESGSLAKVSDASEVPSDHSFIHKGRRKGHRRRARGTLGHRRQPPSFGHISATSRAPLGQISARSRERAVLKRRVEREAAGWAAKGETARACVHEEAVRPCPREDAQPTTLALAATLAATLAAFAERPRRCCSRGHLRRRGEACAPRRGAVWAAERESQLCPRGTGKQQTPGREDSAGSLQRSPLAGVRPKD